MDILLPILLTAIIGGVGWLYRHEKERREAIERQLSEHKYKAYTTLLKIFLNIMKDIKGGKNINPQNLVSQMLDANMDIILYGSDDLIKTYQKFISSSREGKVNLKQFGDIVISIRRDMGNQKTNITSDDVLRQFVDYEDAKVKGLL